MDNVQQEREKERCLLIGKYVFPDGTVRIAIDEYVTAASAVERMAALVRDQQYVPYTANTAKVMTASAYAQLLAEERSR